MCNLCSVIDTLVVLLSINLYFMHYALIYIAFVVSKLAEALKGLANKCIDNDWADALFPIIALLIRSLCANSEWILRQVKPLCALGRKIENSNLLTDMVSSPFALLSACASQNSWGGIWFMAATIDFPLRWCSSSALWRNHDDGASANGISKKTNTTESLIRALIKWRIKTDIIFFELCWTRFICAAYVERRLMNY